MKIKVGDRFRTRFGEIAIIREINMDYKYTFKGIVKDPYSNNEQEAEWCIDGKYLSLDEKDPRDLIEKL